MKEQTFWTRYFDSSKTRSEGRKLPQEKAIDDPTVDELATAVAQIGYDAQIERNASHPQEPHSSEGRVLVETEDSKTDALHAIAAYIPVLREGN